MVVAVIQTTVDLPGPLFRGLKQNGRIYVDREDLLDHIEATAAAFDKAQADNNIGRSFRAFAAAIENATPKECA